MRETMNTINASINQLETEGTDSDTTAKIRKNHFSKFTFSFMLLTCIIFNNASANELYLFSDKSNAVVGTLTSLNSKPVLIEGYIENNILDALEIITSNSSLFIDANSDGTGGLSTDANSDGTGGTSTDANSDGTGGTSTDANSDGTGKKLITVLLACDSNSVSSALVESTTGTETLIIDQVYLNNEIYICK
jgi:hypothetical protein